MEDQEPVYGEVEELEGQSYYESLAETLMEKMDKETLAGLLRERDALEQQVQTPEAIGSCSTKIVGPGGAVILVTSRGASLIYAWDQMRTFVMHRIQEGYKPYIEGNSGPPVTPGAVVPQKSPATSGQSAPVQHQAPVQQQQASAQGADNNTRKLTKMYANVVGDKTYWKVEIDRWKFPATVWPEVLEAAGFDVGALVPGTVYELEGDKWMGSYEVNDKGYPKKITKMWRA